ncbi:hypothetical protein BT63DRAFT_417969 [Microthyrium microscopicum]|uniref:Uncharacterized protein n=1 Tax=Microthyrium microscopicum TaxID=703497 RepID=A0A6A6TWZ0_9PEZI|nr:hypothetical protein BT63DRAFT_417969 [Microthyrium microscopicum]
MAWSFPPTSAMVAGVLPTPELISESFSTDDEKVAPKPVSTPVPVEERVLPKPSSTTSQTKSAQTMSAKQPPPARQPTSAKQPKTEKQPSPTKQPTSAAIPIAIPSNSRLPPFLMPQHLPSPPVTPSPPKTSKLPVFEATVHVSDTSHEIYNPSRLVKGPGSFLPLQNPRDQPRKTYRLEDIEAWRRKSRIDRNVEFLMKLAIDFPENQFAITRLVTYAKLPPGIHPPRPIHVFVDWSNIWIGFQAKLKCLVGKSFHSSLPAVLKDMSFESLALLLQRERPVERRVIAASDDLHALKSADLIGYDVHLLKRVVGKDPHNPMRQCEQGVDEVLQLAIMWSIAEYEPSTLVLATGDGANSEFSEGFVKCIQLAMRRGWRVELIAWGESIAAAYTNVSWINRYPVGQYRVILLDDYVEWLIESA